jgi:hypothetical protein
MQPAGCLFLSRTTLFQPCATRCKPILRDSIGPHCGTADRPNDAGKIAKNQVFRHAP